MDTMDNTVLSSLQYETDDTHEFMLEFHQASNPFPDPSKTVYNSAQGFRIARAAKSDTSFGLSLLYLCRCNNRELRLEVKLLRSKWLIKLEGPKPLFVLYSSWPITPAARQPSDPCLNVAHLSS
ncbi:hypothetical protein QAD02_008579 [Eretmocerus hayati]|uniref:Uncharacterized protein n=1 Tax=Eretmocerus hayati TaxID=131215 RepID=A0ACC2N6Z1_9HYME|nr:hypothetical protein QAD02_008579 [Eretmocerus hayati]